MGNSEQGCNCIRPRDRNNTPTNWKNHISEDFEVLLSKGNKWAESICALLILWDGKLDKLFKNSARWQFFLSKECDKSALEYHVSPIHKNLFKELENDFKDTRNPLGAILVQFLQSYAIEVHDEVWEVVSDGTGEEAKIKLEKVVEDVKSVIEILVRGCLSFYTCIYKVLKNKGYELRGIILSQIISGDLYRLVYDLSYKINKDLCTKVGKMVFDVDEADSKVIQILRQVAISESPFEKLHYLFVLKTYLLSKHIPEEKLNLFVWEHISESKVKDIFVHLYIVDSFTLEPIESSFEYFLNSLNQTDQILNT